jgi:hypothetical protein
MLHIISKAGRLTFSTLLTKNIPRTIVKVDVSKSPLDQPVPLHNRWHPDIPAVGNVIPGEVFRL